MMKKILLIVLGAIVIGGIAAFFVSYSSKNNPGANGAEQAAGSSNIASDTSSLIAGAPADLTIPPGATIQIGTSHGIVTVNNFYKDIISYEDEFLVLRQTADYTITYDTTRSAFYIQAGSSDTRTEAEQAFLQLLGVSTTDACKLDVLEAPPANSTPGFCGAFQS